MNSGYLLHLLYLIPIYNFHYSASLIKKPMWLVMTIITNFDMRSHLSSEKLLDNIMNVNTTYNTY